MISKTLKIAVRNLLKNKTITSINIAGLTIGITISLLIFSFVRKEVTTDNYIPNNTNIYALMNQNAPHLSLEMAQLAKTNIPEISQITSCSGEWSPQVFFSQNNTDFKIDDLLVADSAFFKVIPFETVWGDPQNDFSLSNKVVLTQSLAKKIFGEENPVGKTLDYNSSYLQNEELEVAAVIKDLPHNSSWDFSAVLSFKTNLKIDWYLDNLGWGQQSFSTFVTLPENVNPENVNDKLAHISLEGVPENYKDDIAFSLLPHSELYFNSPQHDILDHGNKYTLSIIEITGILILLLACINYINMVTAQREKRNKTVGIVKTLGSNKRKIIEILASESAIVLLFSIFISLSISQVLIKSLNEITGSQFTFQSVFSGWNLVILFSIFIFTLTITGLIPGYIFSRNKTTLLLKNNIKSSKSNYLRNSLLVFQFTVSIALVTSIFIINQQNKYLSNANPGFEKENIIFATTNDDILDKIQSFKNDLSQIPEISDITFSEEPLNAIEQNWGLDFYTENKKQNLYFAMTHVAPNFLDFFDIPLKNGNNFSKSSEDNYDVLFNTAAFQKYDFLKCSESHLPINDNPNEGKVIGEIGNFNFESMHAAVRPLGFMCSGEGDEVVYLKVNSAGMNNISQILKSVEKTWDKFSPNFPFEYHFLNESWEKLYKQDRQFQKVLSYTTFISIFLSCLGLLGLTFFIIENKAKEIGIRKVNGARVTEVMAMLNQDFIKWIVVAFILATPISYYAMTKWLQNFAYKTEISWWIFALSGFISLVIALITVSWQSWRAANRNPVEALQYE